MENCFAFLVCKWELETVQKKRLQRVIDTSIEKVIYTYVVAIIIIIKESHCKCHEGGSDLQSIWISHLKSFQSSKLPIQSKVYFAQTVTSVPSYPKLLKVEKCFYILIFCLMLIANIYIYSTFPPWEKPVINTVCLWLHIFPKPYETHSYYPNLKSEDSDTKLIQHPIESCSDSEV